MGKNIKYANSLAKLLDARFEFLGIRFGVNSLFEIIPGLGDIIAAALSFYIISLGIKMKVPQEITTKMFMNLGVSVLIGAIPFIGDAFYLFYKPNMRNVELLNKYVGNIPAST